MEGQTQQESIENKTINVPEMPKATEAEIREPKKYKLKLGDQEEEIAEQELTELVKAGRNAHLTRKEADDIKQLLQQLKDNPRKALTDPKLGIDLYKLAEETLLEKIQQDMMTPEQKKIQEYEKRFKEIEEREKTEQSKKDNETLTQAESHWTGEYDKMFYEALTSSGLPKTSRTIKRMAEVAAIQLEQGRDIDAKSIASVVKEDYLVELKDLLGSSDEDALLQLLGDEIGNKLRKADLKRLKGKSTIGQVTGSHSNQSIQSKAGKISALEWREKMERIKRGFE